MFEILEGVFYNFFIPGIADTMRTNFGDSIWILKSSKKRRIFVLIDYSARKNKLQCSLRQVSSSDLAMESILRQGVDPSETTLRK